MLSGDLINLLLNVESLILHPKGCFLCLLKNHSCCSQHFLYLIFSSSHPPHPPSQDIHVCLNQLIFHTQNCWLHQSVRMTAFCYSDTGHFYVNIPCSFIQTCMMETAMAHVPYLTSYQVTCNAWGQDLLEGTVNPFQPCTPHVWKILMYCRLISAHKESTGAYMYICVCSGDGVSGARPRACSLSSLHKGPVCSP